EVARRARQALERLREAPTLPGGNIKALAGHRHLWRYRIGDYRLIYGVQGAVVQLLGIGHRRDVYERFHITPSAGDEWDGDLGWTVPVTPVEPVQRDVKPPLSAGAAGQVLPVALSGDLLRQWLVPDEYHAAVLACETEDALLACD